MRLQLSRGSNNKKYQPFPLPAKFIRKAQAQNRRPKELKHDIVMTPATAAHLSGRCQAAAASIFAMGIIIDPAAVAHMKMQSR